MRSCCKLFLFSLQISSYWSPFLFPVVIFWFNFATLWFMKIINDEHFPHHHLILKNYESTFCLKHCATGTIPDWKTASCNEVMFIFTEPFWNAFPSLIMYNMFSMPLVLTLIISGFVTLQLNHADAFLKKLLSLASSSLTFVLCLALFLHTFCLFVFMVFV